MHTIKMMKPITGLTLASTVLFTYILMIMGTFVTSTGSGLACPDWPLCYGTVAPPLELSIWFEWGHRLLGGITGTLILASTFLVWKYHKGTPRALTLTIVGLLAVAVVLGGVIVLVEAPLLEGFAHVAVISSHLVIATLVLTGLVFSLRSVIRFDASKAVSGRGYVPFLFGAVYLQVVLGILVRYSGATLACPDFPLCNGAVVPEFSSYAVALQFIHRVVALSILAATAIMFVRAVRRRRDVKQVGAVLALVCSQAVFGVLIVLTGMFLPVIIMHGANGFLLLGYLAYLSVPVLFGRGGAWAERAGTRDERIRA